MKEDETLFKRIKEPTIDIYYNGNFLANANEVELRRLIYKVAETRTNGYSVDDNGVIKPILVEGTIKEFPERFGVVNCWIGKLWTLLL